MSKIDVSTQKLAVLAQECPEIYTQVRKGDLRGAVFKLSEDESEVVLESVYNSSQQSYSEFLSQFPAQGNVMHGTCLLMSTETRWAILDFPYLTLNGGRHSKLTFISWSPTICDALQCAKQSVLNPLGCSAQVCCDRK
jgi:hypothetical protein